LNDVTAILLSAQAYRRRVLLVLLGSVCASWLGIALVLVTFGSRSVPAADVSLFGMIEGVLAPLWVWLFLGETAGVFTLAGGALLLCAIAGDALTGIRARRVVTTERRDES
jgi:drug/metabolite transporter (DMT)-like permease